MKQPKFIIFSKSMLQYMADAENEGQPHILADFYNFVVHGISPLLEDAEAEKTWHGLMREYEKVKQNE